MPTYDYVCEKCGKTFEVFHSIKDDPLAQCFDQDCGGALKRKIGGGAGLIFKGSGFYATDYRSEQYKKAEQSDKATSSETPKIGDSDASSSKPKTSPPATSTPNSSPSQKAAA